MRLDMRTPKRPVTHRVTPCVSPLATPYKSKTHAGDVDFTISYTWYLILESSLYTGQDTLIIVVLTADSHFRREHKLNIVLHVGEQGTSSIHRW